MAMPSRMGKGHRKGMEKLKGGHPTLVTQASMQDEAVDWPLKGE